MKVKIIFNNDKLESDYYKKKLIYNIKEVKDYGTSY